MNIKAQYKFVNLEAVVEIENISRVHIAPLMREELLYLMNDCEHYD